MEGVENNVKPAASDKLALFADIPTQVSVKNSDYKVYKPLCSLATDSVVAFSIEGNDEYIALNDIYVQLKIQLLQSDGKPIVGDGGRVPNIATVNLPLFSLWKSLKVFFNNELIEQFEHFGYMQFLLHSVNYSRVEKEGLFSAAGYYIEPNVSEASSTSSPVFKNLQSRFSQGKVAEFMGRLTGSLFEIDQFLCPFINVRLEFYPTSNDFFICDYDAALQKVTYKIHDMSLYVRKFEVLDSINLALEEGRRLKSYTYAFNRITMRSLYLGQGITESPFNVLVHNYLPTRVLMVLISNKAFTGSGSINPYIFNNNNVEKIYLRGGDKIIPPSGPFEVVDFTQGQYATLFQRLYKCMGQSSQDITFNNFAELNCIFGFDLSPTSPHEYQLLKPGNLQVYIKFAKPVPSEGLQLLCLIESQCLLKIDNNNHSVLDPPTI